MLNLNPMTHLVISYQEVLFYIGPHGHWRWLVALRRRVRRSSSWRATSSSTGCATSFAEEVLTMTPAIDVVNVSKVYRRFARKRQFATLKSALLSGSLIRDLQPDETFPALRGVSFQVPEGLHLRGHRPQRIGQVDAAQVRRRHHPAQRAARSPSTAASRR